MAKTIELIDLKIKQINLDYSHQCVIVFYDMVDANNQVWNSGDAYFWVTIPAVPPNQPVPDNWFQLPEAYFPTLLSLQTDADAALTAKFLV